MPEVRQLSAKWQNLCQLKMLISYRLHHQAKAPAAAVSSTEGDVEGGHAFLRIMR